MGPNVKTRQTGTTFLDVTQFWHGTDDRNDFEHISYRADGIAARVHGQVPAGSSGQFLAGEAVRRPVWTSFWNPTTLRVEGQRISRRNRDRETLAARSAFPFLLRSAVPSFSCARQLTTLVNSTDFTVGYFANSKRLSNEPSGAFFFSVQFKDLLE